MRNYFPKNEGTNAYISDVAKKSRKNKETKKETIKKNKIYFPKYEGKIYDPTLSKALNILKQNEEQIIKEIHRRNNNINLLKSEINMNNVNNIHDLDKEKKKIEDRVKFLEKENNLLIEKLEELKNRRESMKYQFEKELGIIENNKKLKFKKFLEDLNNKEKNELIEEKIKNLQEKSKKIQLKMEEDLKEANDRKIHEIERLKKEQEDKIKKYLSDMKEKERNDIKNRNQIAKEQILKIKEDIIKDKEKKKQEQMNKKNNDTTPIYQKIEKNYKEKEANSIKKENKIRKEYMKHINLNEFNEFAKKYDEIKSKQINESNLKMKKEKEEWLKRYKSIPEYVNPLTKLILKEEKDLKQEEERKNLEMKKFKDRQKNYKAPKPLIITVKKESKEMDLKIKKPLIKSSSYSDILRQRMKEKLNTVKNKKEKDKTKNNNNVINKNIINFKLPLISLKERNKQINKSFEKKKNNNQKQELITDYLNQKRLINEKIREKKRNNGELSKLDYTQTNDIKKLLKENGMDEGLLKIAKSKFETGEEKKKQKSLLLKLKGGIANNPELGEEICDLMIDSIQARLSIIQEIENLDDENNENNNENEQNEYEDE